MKLAERGDDEAMAIDHDFLRATRIWNASNIGYGYWYRQAHYAYDQFCIYTRCTLLPSNEA